ncbi:MAG: hypothetical protein ABJF10_17355 [Chthoniobacter sp.]|uniref:hypothetical protein n=1 Tax=Chthoniobacter sp. TaxID=2510640 RepID=UPI0032A839E8
MKSLYPLLAIGCLWHFLTFQSLGWDEPPIVVTPKNQKELGLDFSLTTKKHERTFIVDFAIPPGSKLESLKGVGVFSSKKDFSDPVGLEVPFMGLTRFPSDTKWLYGFRLWLGEETFSGAVIQFKHRDQTFLVHLRDYPRQ